jgi:hypothetical protein
MWQRTNLEKLLVCCPFMIRFCKLTFSKKIKLGRSSSIKQKAALAAAAYEALRLFFWMM